MVLTAMVGATQADPPQDQFESLFGGKQIPYPYSALLTQIIQKDGITGVGQNFISGTNGQTLKQLHSTRNPRRQITCSESGNFLGA